MTKARKQETEKKETEKKETEKQEYIDITCNINKTDLKTNQLIYCSQLYGTFFAVSGKLNVIDGKLKSMTLILINYKGLFNIGMLKETRTSFKPKDGGAELTLHLKANAGRHGRNRPLKVRCDDININALNGLIVTRELHRLSRKKGQNHLNEGLFDAEFYQRDGALIMDLDRLDDVPPLTREDRCKTTVSKFV